ncbi:AAA family ATPase [Methanolobus sp.]|uniref:AAA family ATPase n=1 Tax=Methanolobus sp. TaxID=1874737 RepID=UPI0025E9E92B|nr:AAA family ATPase [Methanolobus sp.]
MALKIKNINIHAFRGIPELEIPLEDNNLLILGENGTGKSSIIDAIEFFFTGKVSHLEGTQGLSLRDHGPHIKFNPNDVKVEITFNPGNIVLNRTFQNDFNINEGLLDYFETTQRGTFILRRAQLLAFIIKKPAERFSAIADILGIESLDEIELSMKRVRDQLQGHKDTKNKEITKLYKELSILFNKKIDRNENVVPFLNEILTNKNCSPIQSIQEIGKHAEEMLKGLKGKNIDKINVLHQLNNDYSNLPVFDYLNTTLEKFNQSLKPLLDEQAQFKLKTFELLDIGKSIISENSEDTCPLCEQTIVKNTLLAEIEKRLHNIQNLSDSASIARSSLSQIESQIEQLNIKLNILLLKIERLPEMNSSYSRLKILIDSLTQYKVKLNTALDLKSLLSTEEFNLILNMYKDTIAESIQATNSLLKITDLSADEKNVLFTVRFMENVKSKYETLLQAQKEEILTSKKFDIADKVYLTFSQTKKENIQELYSLIQADISKYYVYLHPGDPHGDIQLKVTRRASTELKMKCFGQDHVHPKALTSEGHLDSLGLCIFLSFAKKFNEGCSLLILDDIVTTIDSTHRQRICELLYTEFSDKQLIITTHDRIWYEQLRSQQRHCQIEHKFKNVVINKWNLQNGLSWSLYKPRWEKIEHLLQEGDINSAANNGREYLEWLLKKVAEYTNAPVPFKPSGMYTVSDLFTPTKKRVNDMLKDGDFKKDCMDAFSYLESRTILGNFLSHNNEFAANVSLNEVEDFCKAVYELHQLFLCSTCGSFIKYNSDFKIFRCPKTTCVSPFEERTR